MVQGEWTTPDDEVYLKIFGDDIAAQFKSGQLIKSKIFLKESDGLNYLMFSVPHLMWAMTFIKFISNKEFHIYNYTGQQRLFANKVLGELPDCDSIYIFNKLS